jgi:hypothetical protein
MIVAGAALSPRLPPEHPDLAAAKKFRRHIFRDTSDWADGVTMYNIQA